MYYHFNDVNYILQYRTDCETSVFVGVRRVADVRLHVLPHAGRPHRVELQAHRGCAICGHCGRVGHRRAVQQWRRARRLRSGAHHGSHALDGADARDRRVSRHGRHGGRAHHVSACRDPVDAERATRQTDDC